MGWVGGGSMEQIIFFETGPILAKDYARGGKYQSSGSVAQLKKNWRPTDMLPRLYLDRDIKKK